MRERKYVKFRVDMYEDTKFKIIDLKPERDVIHYIWSRLVLLAGKVNIEGELFLSKNIPYTIETLAIEFNRSVEQVKLALEVFIELQMLELTEDSIYKVTNFAKHQNIKVKEKEITNNKKDEEKVKEVDLDKTVDIDIKDKAIEDITVQKGEKSSEASKVIVLQTADKGDAANDKLLEDNTSGDNTKKEEKLLFDDKKNKKRNKSKKDNLISKNIDKDELLDEVATDEEEDGIIEGEITLKNDEIIVDKWSFG